MSAEHSRSASSAGSTAVRGNWSGVAAPTATTRAGSYAPATNSSKSGKGPSVANNLAADVARNVLAMGADQGNIVELYQLPVDEGGDCWIMQKTPLAVRVVRLPYGDDRSKASATFRATDRGCKQECATTGNDQIMFQVPNTRASVIEVAKRASDVIATGPDATLVLWAYGLKTSVRIRGQAPHMRTAASEAERAHQQAAGLRLVQQWKDTRTTF